jgi:hypothetical protein
MYLTGDKQTRINDLSRYLLFRTQIILMIFTVLSSALSQVTLFGICVILMGIIAVSPKDVYAFFQVPSRIIIEWKYKEGNYRDNILSGTSYRKPEDWLARLLLLDYLMIVILGQSR